MNNRVGVGSIITLIVCILLFSSCVGKKVEIVNDRKYIINNTFESEWNIIEGVFLISGEEKQKFQYSKIEYLGKQIEGIDAISLTFYVLPIDNEYSENILYSHSLSQSIPFTLDSDFTVLNASIEGEILNKNTEYNLENIYMKVEYKTDKKSNVDVIVLPTEVSKVM